MGSAPEKVCDICNAELDLSDGYYLPTRSVIASESFWRHRFAFVKKFYEPFGFDERQLLNMFAGSVSDTAGSATPWLVCESCGEFFIFDLGKARACAISGTEPERNGPVEPGECVMFAAPAWEHVYGRWPANVEQPDITDSCDLCAKKMYARELAGSISTAQMDHLRATGVIAEPTLSPLRPGSGTWVICAICLARHAYRLQRLR
jgi:hypothetical protein